MYEDYERAYGLRSVSLRYFNAAAPIPKGKSAKTMIRKRTDPARPAAAAGRRPSVTINGTDYPTPDGTCIRDFIHVSDLAHAHVLALRHLENGDGSESITWERVSGRR